MNEIKPNNLAVIMQETGLDSSEVVKIAKSFETFFDKAKEFETKTKAIVITDVSQVTEMKLAREVRLELKDIRVNAEKVRKELKEKSLREGKAIDGIANVIKALVVPMEEYLENQEKFVERKEQEAKEKKLNERIALIAPYSDPALYNLTEMTDEVFANLLARLKVARQESIDAAKRAEEDRKKKEAEEIEKRKKEQAELARLQEEDKKKEALLAIERGKTEKLEREKKELEEKEKKEAERLAEEKRKQEEKDRKEKEEKEKLERAEAYGVFLIEKGVTNATRHNFIEKKVGNKIELYKLIGTFNIE